MKLQMILVQTVAIIAIGTGIGFAHSKMKPVVISREKPPDVKDLLNTQPKPATPEKTTAPVTPSPGDPVKPAPGDTNAAPNAPTQPKTPTPANPEPNTPKVDPAPPTPAPSAGVEELSQALRDKGHITIAEAKALFEKNPPAYFVDTRHKADYEAGHVKDAFGIPLGAFRGKTPKLLDSIDREEVVVVYCVGGNCDESEEVAKNLSIVGYKKVYVMHAGFPGWKDAGLPFETGPGFQEEE